MQPEEAPVVDDAANHRFHFTEGGVDAELVYQLEGDRLIVLHTQVPEAFRGRGIADRLVQAVADRAKSSGETVVPWCPYAGKWLKDQPDVAAGIKIDWSPPG